MSVTRRVARPLIAATFIASGVRQALRPAPTPGLQRPLEELSKRTGLTVTPTQICRLQGAAMATAGLMFAAGRAPRVASFVMATSGLPQTVLGQPVPSQRVVEGQTVATRVVSRGERASRYLNRLGLLGGALLACVDSDGGAGVGWRARRRAKQAKQATNAVLVQAQRTALQAERAARVAQRRAVRAAR